MTCYDKNGVYIFSDNAIFTGLCGSPQGGGPGGCKFPPWDFAGVGRDEAQHKLAEFGTYDRATITEKIYTFAYYVLDKEKYESTFNESAGYGTVVPYRADGFILISAGPDGVYGSSDDVNNF